MEIKKLNTNWCNRYKSDGKTIEIDEKQRKAMQKQWDKSVMMKCKTISISGLAAKEYLVTMIACSSHGGGALSQNRS